MVKKTIKPVGDQLFIKENVTSPWELAKFSDLKALLSDRKIPYSAEEKLNLPQFAYGRKEGETANQQIYPTKTIVLELDTPSPHKGKLGKKDVFEKWSKIFNSIYIKVLEDEELPYKIIYMTPSMCGLRFIIRLDNPVNDKDEYEFAVLAYLKELKKFGVLEEYYDLKINCGWYVPLYKAYFRRGSGIYSYQSLQKKSHLHSVFVKAVEYTQRGATFEDGNRNNFIYSLACNANRYGLKESALIKYLSDNEFVYNTKEVNATVKSAYTKNKEDFGIWKNRAHNNEATVSMRSHIKKARKSKPIPLIWSGIKEGSLGFVFGLAKSGKSTLCECLAFSISTGLDEFIGLPINAKHAKVLYISLEEHSQLRGERNQLQERFMYSEFGKRLGDNFFTNTEEYPRYILGDEDLKFIEKEINTFEPNIVFIDSLTHLIIDKVEDSSKTNIMMSKLRMLSDRTGATIIIIHHTVKKKDKPLSMMDMAGSRVLAQEADFMIGVNLAPNGQNYLKEVSFRHKALDDQIIPFEINEYRWVVGSDPVLESELFEVRDGRKDDTNKQAILEYLKSIDGPVATLKIKEHFNNEISSKTIHNNLNKLQNEGKIEKLGKGQYKCSVDKKE